MPYILIIFLGVGAVSFQLVKTWKEVDQPLSSGKQSSIASSSIGSKNDVAVSSFSNLHHVSNDPRASVTPDRETTTTITESKMILQSADSAAQSLQPIASSKENPPRIAPASTSSSGSFSSVDNTPPPSASLASGYSSVPSYGTMSQGASEYGSGQTGLLENRWNTDPNLILWQQYKAQYGDQAANQAMIQGNIQYLTNTP